MSLSAMFGLRCHFNRARRNRSAAARRGHQLGVESLESRTVLSTFAVVNAADSGDGSLRHAVQQANLNPGADTITFARDVEQITLTSGELAVTDSLDIQGPGAAKLAISGNQASRVFNVASGSVRIAGVTVADGLADGNASTFPSAGGGIYNQAGATLELVDVHVVNNHSVGDASQVIPVTPIFNLAGGAIGGGVANFGSLTISGSTFRGNSSTGADHVDSSAFSFPGPSFPGGAQGGAISNFGVTSTDGSGIGGGVYDIGSFLFDSLTSIKKNRATSLGDDLFT